MAKYELDYLQKKYPDVIWSGVTYENLMKNIISFNTERISVKTAEITQDSFSRIIKKIGDEGKRFILPDVSDVLPKQSVFIRKGADRGQLLRDTLRDELTKNLRFAVDANVEAGKPNMVARRGVTAGRISPSLINRFQESIVKTFENYTKKDPTIGVPSNIHAIAVTEVRSTINDIKNQYVGKMIGKNPDYDVEKTWIHNRRLSKVPRPGHLELNGKSIPYYDNFKVKEYNNQGQTVGVELMAHPHAPGASPGNIINCNCELDYIIKKKKAK
jgi:hypothetical protein